ncbi:MAG: peptidoglycan recognition family protein [Candidatus Micrarchaeota archaeon]
MSNSTLESLNSLLAGARKSRRQARPPEKTAPTHKPKFEEHFIPIEDKKKEMLAELMEFCTGNRSWRLDSPKCIVIHIDAIGVGLKALYRAFSFVELPKWRKVTPSRPNSVNVSSHFGIAKDGETWQFVPLDIVSVHAVGYMHNSISFELVAKRPRDVTDAQVEKLVDMVAWLCQQYPSIEFVFGHDESYTLRHYFAQEGVYKTNPRYGAWAKGDPGAGTMVRIRERLKEKYDIEKKPG